MRLLTIVLTAFLSACNNSGNLGVGCTKVFAAGVLIELVDADTREPITGATLVLTDGAYTDTMVEGHAGTYLGAHEREGTYQLNVVASNYEPHAEGGIIVPKGHCHVDTQNLTVELELSIAPVTLTFLVTEEEDGSVEIRQVHEIRRPLDKPPTTKSP